MLLEGCGACHRSWLVRVLLLSCALSGRDGLRARIGQCEALRNASGEMRCGFVSGWKRFDRAAAVGWSVVEFVTWNVLLSMEVL